MAAAMTSRSLLSLPCFEASSHNFLMIFCFKKLINSMSAVVVYLWLVATLKKENLKGSCDHMIPLWGEECRLKSQQNSDIVLLCIYILSN